MHCRGSIFHHREMVFHNGFTGKKYLVLLNTPGKNEKYIFVKTTSQKKNKPSQTGCIQEKSLYFIPACKTFFPIDTWVQLYEVYQIESSDIKTNRNISFQDCLDSKMVDDIVNCLFESQDDDIDPDVRMLLKPPFYDSLLKLRDKFQCGTGGFD